MYRLHGLPEELPGESHYWRAQTTSLHQPGYLHQMRRMLLKVQIRIDRFILIIQKFQQNL
jgi:hypothetical protein